MPTPLHPAPPHLDETRLLLVGLLIKLGIIASIAAVLVRSLAFKRYLYRDRRGLREKLMFTLFLIIPLAGGVFVRILVPGFSAGDLGLPGAMLIGLMAGQLAGLAGGVAIALPALAGAHEWLALPMGVLGGLAGSLCRNLAPNTEEIWNFSPFIDLELWRWLRNRLDRPFRDWQALVFGAVTLLTLVQWEVARAAPRLLYMPRIGGVFLMAAVIFTNVLCLAIPIKIWNNTRIEGKLEEQRRLLVQARLDALTSQINPHFLFNTLNSIASLVRFDPDTARVLIVKLSNILRRLLRKHESHVPFREELDFIDDYLDIEVVRFGPEKLRIETAVEPETLDLPVPSMLLQPIVENAIRHGIAPKVEGGRITIRGERVPAGLRIEIEDDGVGFASGAEAGHGIGMMNVRERLRVLYGGQARLEIRGVPGEGTCVRIELPFAAPAPANGALSSTTAPE